MTAVTHFINLNKQPRGGYLPIKHFEKKVLSTSKKLYDFSSENIHSSLVGIAVDYLTRFQCDYDKKNAFKISLKGARAANKTKEGDILLSRIEKSLTNESIKATCRIVSFDMAYRTGTYLPPRDPIEPNKETIENIAEMVKRSCNYLNKFPLKPLYGIQFNIPAEYSHVTIGDCDFLTHNTLIDLKVSKNPPTNKDSFQLLIYYLLGMKIPHYTEKFANLEYLTIFNPRLSTEWVFSIKNIEPKTIEDIEKIIFK